MFNSILNITKEYLLNRNTQETYMEHYLGVPISKKIIKSPLRNDKKPTCSFYKNKKGDLYFKDFATKDSFNFVGVVQHKFGCSFYKALRIIANDFGYINDPNLNKNVSLIKEYSNSILNTNSNPTIQITNTEFSKEELNYWKQFGITLNTLKKFKIFSCKNVFLNGCYLTSNNIYKPDFIFGYFRGLNKNNEELWRIYFPNRKEYRFLSNWKSTMIQGDKQLSKNNLDLLVITKSLKDVMCLYEFGISAIAPVSETVFLTEKQFEKIKSKFKKIVLFYDNDYAGIVNMNKIRKKYDVDCIFIPKKFKVKDISDFYKCYGFESTSKLINTAKKNLNV